MNCSCNKDTVVIHSGGMDSSICLALAIQEFGVDNVLSLGFDYGQRHNTELEAAAKICEDWTIDRLVVKIDCLRQVTENALLNHAITIEHKDHSKENSAPNTLVVGRNGLMARLGAIQAHRLGAHCIYMGAVLEDVAGGYRDCSRHYMDLMEKILKIDLDDPIFEIRTPLTSMTKQQTMELAQKLGVLDYLLEETVSCYEGVRGEGCKKCPACILRKQGLEAFATNFSNKSRV